MLNVFSSWVIVYDSSLRKFIFFDCFRQFTVRILVPKYRNQLPGLDNVVSKRHGLYFNFLCCQNKLIFNNLWKWLWSTMHRLLPIPTSFKFWNFTKIVYMYRSDYCVSDVNCMLAVCWWVCMLQGVMKISSSSSFSDSGLADTILKFD